MSRAVMLVPTGEGVGLTSTCLGLVHALDRKGLRVGYCKPIAQKDDRSVEMIKAQTSLNPPSPFRRVEAEHMMSHGEEQVLLEEITARYNQAAEQADLVVVEGLRPEKHMEYSGHLNEAIADAIDAGVVLVGALDARSSNELADHFNIHAAAFRDEFTVDQSRILGCVLNKVPLVPEGCEQPGICKKWLDENGQQVTNRYAKDMTAHRQRPLAIIPQDDELSQLRIADVAQLIGASVLNAGQSDRRVKRISVFARSVAGGVQVFGTDGALIVTAADRHDVIMAASLAALKGVRLAGLLLSGEGELNQDIYELCKPAFDAGLPVLTYHQNTFATTQAVLKLNPEIPPEDSERLTRAKEHFADHFDPTWLDELANGSHISRLSPPAFRYRLVQAARSQPQRIVLPEGNEPRTVQAAAIVAERGTAVPVLLGNREEILGVAAGNGVNLEGLVEIVEPTDELIERYVPTLVELRKKKGMTEEMARDQLKDTVVLGTMMLKRDEVDGLVSGAVHTTADTIRPALQIIKTAPGSSLVSSVFFMCLPDQVMVFGDCAVNPNPSPEQLADIALQSADSAKAFGLPVRVAMISYSTGASGAGEDVAKVAEATRIARERAPELAIDGPLQYDAAVNPKVGKSKAPGSPVAGQATVLVFPDLNTGNTTYKAVQRSANVVSMGPMLQGLAKAVNDLSRGALVEDIVLTIALTAIQAQQMKQAAVIA